MCNCKILSPKTTWSTLDNSNGKRKQKLKLYKENFRLSSSANFCNNKFTTETGKKDKILFQVTTLLFAEASTTTTTTTIRLYSKLRSNFCNNGNNLTSTAWSTSRPSIRLKFQLFPYFANNNKSNKKLACIPK